MKEAESPGIDGQFIELGRTFHELSMSDIGNERMFEDYYPVGDSLNWEVLLNEKRLVILSEAGSGKTTEIYNTSQRLKKENKYAFFLRLEHISSDLELAFEVGSYTDFVTWIDSDEEGWLFLDSVDESRLRGPRDFELAIRKLGRCIIRALNKAHIIITSRQSAWRAKEDLELVKSEFSCIAYQNSALIAAIPSSATLTLPDDNIFKIVALDDLNCAQASCFIKAKGISHAQALLDDIERANAWTFATRPQDLEELAVFWKERGEIGSRIELIRNSIDRRLTERDQERDFHYPLSPDKARRGVRLLAAATTLMRTQTIKIPGCHLGVQGIDAAKILPEWTTEERTILLSRPIFDEAIYGQVRFHHRAVREYLTAEWLNELLEQRNSRRAIEGLIFRQQYGQKIITPALRPVLPWLCLLDSRICERIAREEPAVFFEEERGDPGQLPLTIRRTILREICEQISDNSTGRNMRDRAIVQRFSKPDLHDDIFALLQKYEGDDTLTAFLIRMIWLGKITGLTGIVLDIALRPGCEQYVFIVAYRALKETGTSEQLMQVRKHYLTYSNITERDIIYELIDDEPLTESLWQWLLACLKKLEPKEHYSPDALTLSIEKMLNNTEIEALPALTNDLNGLLNTPPVTKRFSALSEQYSYLIKSAAEMVRRLILIRHQKVIDYASLDILHKLPGRESSYNEESLKEIKQELAVLIQSWPELNQAFFWFEVDKARIFFNRPLISCWQVPSFDGLWHFTRDDFPYALEQISSRDFIDDKQIALTIAFELYREANRPRAWREKLKRVIANNEILAKRLHSLLHPPVPSEQERKWKEQEARWARETKAVQEKEDKMRHDWKRRLTDNVDRFTHEMNQTPGVLTDQLFYLYEKTREGVEPTEYGVRGNWQILIPEFNESVALFYRNATIAFWRHYNPDLNSEVRETIIGLVGLEIEANEVTNWPANLTTDEAELACKYAASESNGFPDWFERLYRIFPQVVTRFITAEMRRELSVVKTENQWGKILEAVRWSAQWIWKAIAADIYQLLETDEPKRQHYLKYLLKIIHESDLSDKVLSEQASKKCYSLTDDEHLTRWYAVWTGTEPTAAIASLTTYLRNINEKERTTQFAMLFITTLCGDAGSSSDFVRPVFRNALSLKALYLLMRQYIVPDEDINSGSHRSLRQEAQRARDRLCHLLTETEGKVAFDALVDIANTFSDDVTRQSLLLRARFIAARDGNLKVWSAEQVKDFHERQEMIPTNHRELAELAEFLLLDFKDDLEQSDSSIAAVLQGVDKETVMRNFIVHELRGKASGRYTITQEEELADAKRPDLRFNGNGFDSPVPVELKLADKWTGPALFERLENQLCGDYLRDTRSGRGIFMLINRNTEKNKGWQVPEEKANIIFKQLVERLQQHWKNISHQFQNIDDIRIIGVDLAKRFIRQREDEESGCQKK
ncbi:hypothetical protein [Enterobacter sp.]|uniref:NACHT domain-containing protein n=1 Tax=Enterobacter sp. TaxID=42895 RepID=UPI00296EC430|nr:hypothetical protein [Enterobacter sp.]